MGLTQLTGEVLDEKYRIERELGQGGMGAVYLATHLGTGRPVAVKVITPQFMMNDEFVERFRREAKAAGRLHHPNVVNVTDFGFAHIDGQRIAYLVMEYLDGCTLADVLAEESQLPIDWVVDILDQTSSAIEEAHQQGIVHRDLKPDNIWLEPNRRGGYTVKVLDFGLAKLGDVESAGTDQPASLRGNFSGSFDLQGSTQTITDRALKTSAFESETQVRSADLSESATQIQLPRAENDATLILDDREHPSTLDQEDVTKILSPGNSETATRLQPALTSDDERTRVMDRTTAQNDARETVPADGLTRVGSILGTPVYMSPEQCRGEALDARSDIYSLGVIGYQMIAGEPPFKGAPFELMRLHMEVAPPPLREKTKKVPKRMAKVIMSALAKQPADRPATAAGFASAIHATSEGTGGLVRRAFALYVEHFPKFFRVTLLLNLPLILLNAALLVNAFVRNDAPVLTGPDRPKINFSTQASGAFEIVLSILMFFATFFINAVIVGATIRMVTQLFLSPLRPLQLGTAYRAVKKRLKPLLWTIVLASIRWVLGLILIIPGILMFIRYSLVPSVVMMEGLKGRAALKRSKSLVKRCWRSILVILCLQWAIPTAATSLIAVPLALALKMAQIPRAPVLTGRATTLFTVILNTIVVPLIATMMALVYLKARQIGGETLGEVLSQFEEEDTPRTKWQMRMRERLHVTTKA